MPPYPGMYTRHKPLNPYPLIKVSLVHIIPLRW